MTTANLLNRVITAQMATQNLTDDQLEMVSGGQHGGPYEGCRLKGNPNKGNYRLTCWEYKNN